MSVSLHNIQQGTKEWHKIREGKYTGSNADKIFRFGKIPYSQNDDSGWGGNFYTKRGHILEDEAIDLYERITGIEVLRIGFITNDKYPDCGYSPDGVTMDSIVEVKAFQGDRHEAVRKYREFKITAQIEYGKCIAELKKGVLLLYNPDLGVENALIIIDIPYNRSIQSNLKRILREGNHE